MITQSKPEDRHRIALAWKVAEETVAGIPKDGDARPRIIAGFMRSEAYKAAGDIARVI